LFLLAIDHVTGGAPALGEVGSMIGVGGHRERSAQPGYGNDQNPNLPQNHVDSMLPRYQMTYAIHRRQRKWVRLSGYKVDRQARGTKRAFMTEITHFVALAFDLVDGGLVAGEAVDCASPAVAIQTAQGQWKILGHAGAVAFSRTSDFEKAKFNYRHVLRRFGQVPDEYTKENDDP